MGAFQATVTSSGGIEALTLNKTGGLAGQFLRQDGEWATISSGTVTSITAGLGLIQNGTAADPIIDVGLGNGIATLADKIELTTLSANWNAGSVYTITANDFIGSSDERLKENIAIFQHEKINSVYKSFNFKENKQDRIGVIAQELEKTNPEFIRINDDGFKSVSYSDLHSAEIAYLKQENKILKEKLELIMIKLEL
jgi:hypothetical protein